MSIFESGLYSLRVQLRTHLGRQQIRPAHVRHLAQALEALLDEGVGAFRAAEQYSNNTSPLRQVAPARERTQVPERVRVILARGQHQPTQGGHPRVQAGLPVSLPVRPAALARAVQMGTVVAALVGLPGLRQCGRCVAPRVPALEVVVPTVMMAGRFGRVERHPAGDPSVQPDAQQVGLGRARLLWTAAALVGTAAGRSGGGGAADRHRAAAVIALPRPGRIALAASARLHRFDLQRVVTAGAVGRCWRETRISYTSCTVPHPTNRKHTRQAYNKNARINRQDDSVEMEHGKWSLMYNSLIE
uniref:Uncharacterized protein n=1 Tax=Anopheles culicifacies TaxID=139723 RepID=A0A182LRV3_9DIPT